MRIYLVRHGETDYNKNGYMQGRMETSLNEEGINQIELCAKKLSSIKFDTIISSSQRRALQTANIIARYHKQNEVITEDLLQEIDCGIWSGKSWDSIKEEYQDIDFSKLKASKFVELHCGESYDDVRFRIKDFFEKIDDILDENDTVLIVTHGFIIKSIVSSLLNININNKNSFHISNAGITIIDRFMKKQKSSLITLNDISHLMIVDEDREENQQVY